MPNAVAPGSSPGQAPLGQRELRLIASGSPDAGNVRSIAEGLRDHAARFGLDLPHRQVHFVCQLAHESGRFRYDREIWGPTAAQARYDTRPDLGNTKALDGDGYKNRGRGPIQLTGGGNIGRFEDWAVSVFGRANVPDFSGNPDLINTDPWEFLSAVWYWEKGNPTGKSLNVYADANNIEAITRKINGGLNGYADRLDLYTRTALVFLGYALTAGAVRRFQIDAGFTGDDADDIAGARTRGALHARLKALPAPAARQPDDPGPVSEPTPVVDPPMESDGGLLPAPPNSAPARPAPAPGGGFLAALAAFLRAIAAVFRG